MDQNKNCCDSCDDYSSDSCEDHSSTHAHKLKNSNCCDDYSSDSENKSWDYISGSDLSGNDTSGDDSFDNCKKKVDTENPPKEGYERIYSKWGCGGYYDRPILKDGYERCSKCKNVFSINSCQKEQTSDKCRFVCTNCFNDKSVRRCSECGKFLFSNYTAWYFELEKENYGKNFCRKCRPFIIFYFNVHNMKNTCIELEIPRQYEWKLRWKMLYGMVAEKLGVKPNEVLINNIYIDYYKNKKLCPIEISSPVKKIFDVILISVKN
ncbi:MAG: putative orfan [Satyrvirus sp.]|uniref:Putative orfan n=1 Tax=Satyrvirus sp. TaxID=2487771 RepID=A0A3G5AFE9_9VIRU|nr:MAG: putative orfan [Satyrvirus sp.]